MTDRIIAFLILCLVFSLPLGMAAVFTGEVMLNFVFFWPLFMSALWITGGLYFWFYRERHWKNGATTRRRRCWTETRSSPSSSPATTRG